MVLKHRVSYNPVRYVRMPTIELNYQQSCSDIMCGHSNFIFRVMEYSSLQGPVPQELFSSPQMQQV